MASRKAKRKNKQAEGVSSGPAQTAPALATPVDEPAPAVEASPSVAPPAAAPQPQRKGKGKGKRGSGTTAASGGAASTSAAAVSPPLAVYPAVPVAASPETRPARRQASARGSTIAGGAVSSPDDSLYEYTGARFLFLALTFLAYLPAVEIIHRRRRPEDIAQERAIIIDRLQYDAAPAIFAAVGSEAPPFYDEEGGILYSSTRLNIPSDGVFKVSSTDDEEAQATEKDEDKYRVKLTLGKDAKLAEHLKVTGVKRPGYGVAGEKRRVFVNALHAAIPGKNIYQYDVIKPDPASKEHRRRVLDYLRLFVAPDVFRGKHISYDRVKILYAPVELDLPGSPPSGEFDVPMPSANVNLPPKLHVVTLTWTRTTKTEMVRRFIKGEQDEDVYIQSGFMGLNAILKTMPLEQHYPTLGANFYTPDGFQAIGAGIELWRGVFHSFRPTLGRMIVNVDPVVGMMFLRGPLIRLCLEYLNLQNPQQLNRTLRPAIKTELARFIKELKIQARPAGANAGERMYTIMGLSELGANQEQQGNAPLTFPAVLCVLVPGRGNGPYNMIPLERCTVKEGQPMRRGLPSDARIQDRVLKFSTQKPKQKLETTQQILEQMQYGKSQTLADFGVDVGGELLSIDTRLLSAPRLIYGRNAIANPKNGSWNLAEKKFFKPATVSYWVLAVVDGRSFDTRRLIEDFVQNCRVTGINILSPNPLVQNINGQAIIQHLNNADEIARQRNPNANHAQALFVVILPDASNSHMYHEVKHWGEVQRGVSTQCLRMSKCRGAGAQYWANVAAKINPKRGGLNAITEGLVDPRNPMIIMGADVIHPAAHTSNRPSFAGLVCTVDDDAVKYVPALRIQRGKLELIPELGEMVEGLLRKYKEFRVHQGLPVAPKQLLFFRDGVSESQFSQVIEQELPLIRAACTAVGIAPKITLVVVVKRHHIKLLPQNDKQADRSGNVHAGTVFDRDITHPHRFDFYLVSQGGLLGTSRPAHYSVLHDENNFSADSLQKLSFALCHTYARATRSVGIPAPVYYADLLCSRAKFRFDPHDTRPEPRSDDPEVIFQDLKERFKPLHQALENFMHFM
ncbi:Argonaute-like protein [Mycena kentingensis (nom. inval.)]|nr:Argonaute-like protein [Mycena kentingensis (nom. inval.)]